MRLQSILSKAPLPVLDWLKANADKGYEQVTTDQPYYSKVRVQATMVVGGGVGGLDVTYTVAAQNLQFFSYKIGDAMPIASGVWPAGFTATYAETNLNTAQQTNLGRLVVINGIGLQCEPTAEPELLKALMPNLSLSCGYSDQNTQIKLGKASFSPGNSTIIAAGNTQVVTPPLNASSVQSPGAAANGWQQRGNMRRLQDPILWYPTTNSGAGGAKTNFLMNLEIQRTTTVVVTARAASGTAVAAVTGVSTAGAVGSYIDFYMELESDQFGARGDGS